MARAEYDVLDLESGQFPADQAAFNAMLQEFDKRIAAVILQAPPVSTRYDSA